jgi:hypothetical protein
MARLSLHLPAEDSMAKDEIRKHGAVTEYRPERDDVSGGSDKSVQTEAIGAQGSQNIDVTSSTSRGGGGEFSDEVAKPDRAGGEREDSDHGLTSAADSRRSR